MAKVQRSLAGKVVAITGGARGIGRATAAALVGQGAKVAIGDIEAPLAERTAQELGAGTIGLTLDVTERGSFAAFLDQVESRLGPLDVLINNAGIMPTGPFVQESDAMAKRMVDINLHGVIYGSKLALERFLPRHQGHLVNIASIAGKAAGPHVATYCATKHAVVGLTEALRQELAGSGIDLTVVMPVGVNTELYSGLQPLRGMKTPEPEDVAAAIVDALKTGRYEVYLPKRMNATVRFTTLLPLRARDAINRALGGHRAITDADQTARAAYDARMKETVARGDGAPSAARGDARPGDGGAESPPPAGPSVAAVTDAAKAVENAAAASSPSRS